jgi:hypothetical protein
LGGHLLLSDLSSGNDSGLVKQHLSYLMGVIVNRAIIVNVMTEIDGQKVLFYYYCVTGALHCHTCLCQWLHCCTAAAWTM